MTIQAGGTGGMANFGDGGLPILFLHGEDGVLFNQPFVSALARHHRVWAPLHPGWSPGRPRGMRTLDDIAYLYLDVLDDMDEPMVLVGTSLGAWLAAEMATKCGHNIRACVLISPLGIRTTPPDVRTFVDLFAVSPEELEGHLYGDPSRGRDLRSLTSEQFVSLAYAQESVARVGWCPYLHNPSLSQRLHRIAVPTMVIAGGLDSFVLDPGYYETYAGLIGPNACVQVIADAGHRVEEEQPDQVASVIRQFVQANGSTDPADVLFTAAGTK